MSQINKFLPLNRRWFLRSLAFAGGAALTLPLAQRRSLAASTTKATHVSRTKSIDLLKNLNALPQSDRPLKIVILGAGMAGLTAAYELEKLGHTCVILEADRSHIGGRVRTMRFEGGLSGEAGAMRIPTSHALTRHYIEQMKLQLRPFVMGNPEGYYYQRGQRVRSKDSRQLSQRYKLTDAERQMSVDDIWAAAMYKPLEGVSDQVKAQITADVISNDLIHKYDESSMLEMCQAAGLSDEAIEMMAVAYSYNGNLHNSALGMMRDDPLWTAGFDELVGGMDVLPNAIAQQLKSRPRMGCQVIGLERYDQSNKAAAIYIQNGSTHREEGDFVLCTIPFPVLANMVDVPFSGAKQRVIQGLSYDSSTKVLAVTRDRFWEREDGIFGGGSFSDLPLVATFYPSDNAQAKDPTISARPAAMLASYTWGTAARRLGSLAPAQRHEVTQRALAKLHPQTATAGMVQRMASWAWDSHPWSLGAFTFLMPGQQRSLYADVVAPEGRIYFAGEHASTDNAWINGAIESALQAVQQMLVTT